MSPAKSTRTAKVLVVDDDPALRFLMQEILEGHGLEVVSCESPIDALELIDGVDVVVSDYAMPEMDGLEFHGKLRAINPALPFILITSQGSERLAVRALMQGAYH